MLSGCSFLYLLLNGECKAVCPKGYFEDLDQGVCVNCHATCGTCSGPLSDDCETCAPLTPKLYEGTCLEECPAGTYYHTSDKECQGDVLTLVKTTVLTAALFANLRLTSKIRSVMYAENACNILAESCSIRVNSIEIGPDTHTTFSLKHLVNKTSFFSGVFTYLALQSVTKPAPVVRVLSPPSVSSVKRVWCWTPTP